MERRVAIRCKRQGPPLTWGSSVRGSPISAAWPQHFLATSFHLQSSSCRSTAQPSTCTGWRGDASLMSMATSKEWWSRSPRCTVWSAALRSSCGLVLRMNNSTLLKAKVPQILACEGAQAYMQHCIFLVAKKEVQFGPFLLDEALSDWHLEHNASQKSLQMLSCYSLFRVAYLDWDEMQHLIGWSGPSFWHNVRQHVDVARPGSKPGPNF